MVPVVPTRHVSLLSIGFGHHRKLLLQSSNHEATVQKQAEKKYKASYVVETKLIIHHSAVPSAHWKPYLKQ